MTVESKSRRAVRVPLAAAPAKSGAPTEEQLLAALDGQIERVPVRWTYQLGLLAVTAVLLLLPLVYVGLICLVGMAVYWHTVNDVGMLGAGRGRGAILIVVIYLTPIIVGGLLVAFMIKPLFARRAKREVPFTLSRSEQRLLYTFVGKLCRVVGARQPSRIDVDCRVNASASFADGLLGLLTGKLVLTIGMPLAAGLSVRELTGVLAHEFGHFAQGTGMRLTYVARSINAWFARVVYERDSWDDWLLQAAQSDAHWAINLIAHLSRLMVWLTRRILWLLMMTGHGISSFMLRQMEFDADRYEARVAGCDLFARTSERVVMLSVAQNAAFNDLSTAWRERRLCDDLSRLIIARDAQMPADVRKAVRQHATDGKTGWFDSHPCDADRIRSAAREGSQGLFRIEAPAAVLFNGFEDLSRRATELFYRENLGSEFKPQQVVSTESVVAQNSEQQKAGESLGRFFQGLVSPIRPVFPSREMDMPADLNAAAELLLAARSRLLEAAPAAREAAKQFAAADDQLVNVLRVQTLLQAGVPGRSIKLAELGLPGTTDDASLRATKQAAERARAKALEDVSRVARDAMARVNVVLSLAEKERKSAESVPAEGEYELTAAAEKGSNDLVYDALVALRSAADGIEQIRREFFTLGAGLSLCKDGQNPEQLVGLVVRTAERLHNRLLETHKTLRCAAYPYEHMERGATLSRYCVELVPPADQVVAVYRAAESTLDGVYNLYVRLMSDLAHRAEAMEASMGLEPLEAVEEPAAA